MATKSDHDVMEDFFSTHTYNEEGDWRSEPKAAEDPDDDKPAKEPK